MPEGALELPEGVATGEADSGKGGDRPWLEREPAPEPALDLEEIETVPELDAALDQEAAIPDSTGELDEALASGGERPVMGEMGRRRPAQFCWNRSEAGGGPLCYSRRRSWSSGQVRRRPWLRTAGAAPWHRLWPFPRGDRSLFPLRRRRGTAADKAPAGGLAGRRGSGPPDRPGLPADSRRYDRGFSLY